MSRRKRCVEWHGLTQDQAHDLWWRLYQNGDRPKLWEGRDGFGVRCWTGRKPHIKKKGDSMYRLPYEAQLLLGELAQSPAIAEELSERTGYGPTLVRSCLDSLAKLGLATRNDRGEWRPTPAGVDWLEANRPDDLPAQ